MRYYLDTNILVFIMHDVDDISADVKEIMADYENLLFTSSACVHELIHLTQIGRFGKTHKKREIISAQSLIKYIREIGITIVPVNELHLQTLSMLPLFDEHHDPNDRLIAAQAITDGVPLISSDRKFTLYTKYGLNFIYNER